MKLICKRAEMKNLDVVLKKWDAFLKSKGEDDYLTIYVHIPFCASRCRYCGYSSSVLKDVSQVDGYLKLIAKEMSLFSPVFRGAKISSLYVGGGTPSIMSIDQMKRLFEHIQSNFELDVCADNMFSIETHPGDLDTEKIDFFADSFINRVSIGVQSFDEAVLKAERRVNPPVESILFLLEYLSARFKSHKSLYSINVDLMLGLHRESRDSIQRGLEILSDMDLTRITLYASRQKRTNAEQKKFEEYVVSSVRYFSSCLTKYYLTHSDLDAFYETNEFYHKGIKKGFHKWYCPIPSLYNNNIGFGPSESFIIPLEFFYTKVPDGYKIADHCGISDHFKAARDARGKPSKGDVWAL